MSDDATWSTAEEAPLGAPPETSRAVMLDASRPSPPETSAERDAMLEAARRASDLLKALAHETRLFILCVLADGEMSVSELERMLCMPQAAVSQHLARLRLDRLVAARREGRSVYYRIADEETAAIVGVLYNLFCKEKLGERRDRKG